MISLSRERNQRTIDESFRGEKLVEASLELLIDHQKVQRGELDKHKFKPAKWKKAKAQLLNETFNKCAYCETPTAVVSYGDVEHYRPKSKYWWLAYCLDNYLASCAICNQRYKQSKFKIVNRKLKTPHVRSSSSEDKLNELSLTLVPDPLDQQNIEGFIETHKQERPLLLNPYFDSPEKFFAWQASTVLREVSLVPNPTEQDSNKYVEEAKDVCGLNRPELKRLRFFSFKPYLIFKQTLLDERISSGLKYLIEEEISTLLMPETPFAGMFRFFESTGSLDEWKQNGFLID